MSEEIHDRKHVVVAVTHWEIALAIGAMIFLLVAIYCAVMADTYRTALYRSLDGRVVIGIPANTRTNYADRSAQ